MKNKICRFIPIITFILCMSSFLSHAQPPPCAYDFIPETQDIFCLPMQSVTSTQHINADMYSFYRFAPALGVDTRRRSIAAIAFDDVGTGSQITILEKVIATGATNSVNISIPGMQKPDIVIADDPANPGVDLLVLVVYENGGTFVFLQQYRITGIAQLDGSGKPALAITSLGWPTQLSSNSVAPPYHNASNAHIDMAGDINGATVYTQQFNALYDYTIMWTETGTTGNEIRAFKGSVLTPITSPPTTQLIGNGLWGDVAMTLDLATIPLSQKSHFTFYDPATSNGTIYYGEWDHSTSAVTSSILENNVCSSTVYQLTYSPRIEAANIMISSGPNNTNNDVAWQVIAEVFDPSGTSTTSLPVYQIHTYASAATTVKTVNYSNLPCIYLSPINPMSTALFTSAGTMYSGVAPAVACGNGLATKGLSTDDGNRMYLMGIYLEEINLSASSVYLGMRNMIATNIDSGFQRLSQGISPGSPNSAQYSCPQSTTSGGSQSGGPFPSAYAGGLRAAYAVTNSSNDGYDAMSVFTNNNPSLIYSFTNNTGKFKPTDVADLNLQYEVNIYPNPASTHITIANVTNATYSITDVTGRVLKTGSVVKNNTRLDVSTFPAGVYIINLDADGIKQNVKFSIH